ncbi:MAG: putative rane protein, partial [Frankiaceae bacterium]|nr:putative rane protein [Frankiaceae bacterium]
TGTITGTMTGTPTATPTTTPSCPPTQCSDTSRLIIVALHQANVFEIRKSELAFSRSRNADIQHMARDVIRDHRWLDSDLRAVARTLNVQLTSTLTAAQNHKLHLLKELRGSAFDRAWVRIQIEAHTQALALIDRYLKSNCDQGVRKLVEQSRVVVAYHLWLMQRMQRP